MSLALTDTPKFTVTRTGLEVHAELAFDEWAALAPALGEAARGVAFVVGDWLVYGSSHFGLGVGKTARVSSGDYDAAVARTGLDRSTLQTYAHVARRVAASLRNKDLSWEHHKVVAKLPPASQGRWLEAAEKNGAPGCPVSTRRLRRSIQAGRLLRAEELEIPSADRAIENHIPHVNRIVGWWSKMREQGWLEEATSDQREALKRDLEPVVKIYKEL